MVIITPQNTGMTNKTTQPLDEPPPYDSNVINQPPLAIPSPIAEESHPLLHSPSYATAALTYYRYPNPATNQEFPSELPPGHPQIVCLQRGHEPLMSFGILGIIAGILWFPVGIGCCLLDRRSTCARCGAVLATGICD